MKIIVCVKFTPDAQDIRTHPDGSISMERANWIIGGFDLQAVETGVRLGEQTAGTVTAISIGPLEINNSKLKKDLLSRGPDDLVLVADERLRDADTATTAEVLAKVIQRIGPFDLVLCGEGSADLYFQQVGLQLGERLGLPSLNAIGKLVPAEDRVTAERMLEDEIEVLRVPLPAVLSVTTDISQPRLPTMKQIVNAGRKPVLEWSLADIGIDAVQEPAVEVLRTGVPHRAEHKRILLQGTPQEIAQNLIEALKKEGVL
jgi:electron transfer flavoprotein beta subunit